MLIFILKRNHIAGSPLLLPNTFHAYEFSWLFCQIKGRFYFVSHRWLQSFICTISGQFNR